MVNSMFVMIYVLNFWKKFDDNNTAEVRHIR